MTPRTPIPARPLVREADVLRFTVPLVPPSVNHYKMRTRRGVTFVSKEAISFKQHVWMARPIETLCNCDYAVLIRVFLGKGQKGDVDNFAKCVLDGMVEAAIIDTDAAVQKLTIEKYRDASNPRTEIEVRAL